MQRICKASGQPFEITSEDWEFYKKVSPKIGGKVFEIPPPTLCPDERQRRRLAWRNEYTLYRRECDHCHKNIVSIYPAKTSFPVYCAECWWSEEWDGLEYERNFDFGKSFFLQIRKLFDRVPRQALFNSPETSENSEFTNFSGSNKNCYCLFSSGTNENCFYGSNFLFCRDSMDSLQLEKCELCYASFNLNNCYQVFYSSTCLNCSESWFLRNCIGCKNCFGCSNLSHKEYYIFNEKHSKEQYFKKISELELHRYSSLKKLEEDLKSFFLSFPQKYYFGSHNEQCSGDDLSNCKAAQSSFFCADCESIKYCNNIYEAKNCYDFFNYGKFSELIYECHYIGNRCYQVSFSDCCKSIKSSSYCIGTSYSSDCFGCVGLRHKQYCIFNKQYSKAEYEQLVPKIIEHMRQTQEWGEFFPTELSPFAYNETVAQEYFPLTKEEVLARGWKWRDETHDIPQVEKIIPANLLPDSIHDIPDDILNWAIECEETGKPFVIQKPELEFYRKMHLPIPHFHPDVRHAHRMAKRNPRKLWQRNCDSCGKPIETSYSPDRPEKVYCEECYQKAVY